jgi:aminocarboxymuconate-semialdehyde decarboxylase
VTAPVVDIHVHAVPSGLNEKLEAGWSPEISVTRSASGQRHYQFPSMDPSPPAPHALEDLGTMADWATAKGISVQLIGPWTDLFGYTLSPAAGEGWSRLYNEALVAACEGDPRREPIGMIPLQDASAAVRVLEEAKRMGCRGVEIGTDLATGDLGDPALDDVWASAAAEAIPVLLHPNFLSVPAKLKRHGMKNSFGRASATGLALTQLIHAGVMERHPTLVLIAAQGGGAFVPLIDRLIRNQEIGWAESNADLAHSISRLYWDSIVLDPQFLAYLVGKLGADRVLLGSDHPFPWEPDPVMTVRAANLPPDSTAAILGGTAARLFGLAAE